MTKAVDQMTLTEAFLSASDKPVTQVAFRYFESSKWNDIAWPEYFKAAEKIAAGLASLGIKRGDRVAIMSNTRYQWAIADLAVLGMGCVTVPIYQSATREDVEFIFKNSQAVATFIEDDGQFQKIKNISINTVISFGSSRESKVITWQALLKKGDDFLRNDPAFYRNNCKQNSNEDVATIVYTSGTTGQPKGVLLLHSCITSECADIKNLLELGETDSTLTFLPFAHIFGRVELWANVFIGWKMCFAESIDRIAPNMIDIKPTFMMAVPRIFEKIYGKVLSGVEDGSPLKKKIFHWAVSVGSQVSKHRRENQEVPIALGLQYRLAYKLVFTKLNARLGGKLKFMVSGGAPLSKEIAEFFHAAGILILEGYGLTETTAAVAVNTPYKYRFGTVGPALGDSQIKIAPDGEVMIKGKKVFREYFQNPESTKEALNSDNWFFTGDIGEIDCDGFLKITDRKKDLIKTAGGKYVAPQKLENLLKTNPLISQVVVYGDKMRYLVGLFTLNPEELKKLAAEYGLEALSMSELVNHGKIRDTVSSIISEKNRTLSSFETIKHFKILAKDFTVEEGELTPSLKIKRKYLSQKYAEEIQDLYK